MAILKKAVGRVKRRARLPTFNLAQEFRHRPHKADIGEIKLPPFKNVKFTAFRKIILFRRSSYSFAANCGGATALA
jgi:hypothetical protein